MGGKASLRELVDLKELKKGINALLEDLGKEHRYKIVGVP